MTSEVGYATLTDFRKLMTPESWWLQKVDDFTK